MEALLRLRFYWLYEGLGAQGGIARIDACRDGSSKVGFSEADVKFCGEVFKRPRTRRGFISCEIRQFILTQPQHPHL